VWRQLCDRYSNVATAAAAAAGDSGNDERVIVDGVIGAAARQRSRESGLYSALRMATHECLDTQLAPAAAVAQQRIDWLGGCCFVTHLLFCYTLVGLLQQGWFFSFLVGLSHNKVLVCYTRVFFCHNTHAHDVDCIANLF
jgi:hypothetical protein